MKLLKIKKILFKQSVIVVFILLCLGGGILVIDTIIGDYDAQINAIKAQTNLISTEATGLTSRFDEARGGINLYGEIKQKMADKKLTISKNILKDVVSEVLKEREFSGIDVTVGDIKTRDEPAYKMSVISAESSIVTVKLKAMTDVDVFALAHKIKDSFSAVKYTNITLSVDKPLGEESLLEIRQKGFSPIVTATISFLWSGMQDNTPSDIDLLLKDGGKK